MDDSNDFWTQQYMQSTAQTDSATVTEGEILYDTLGLPIIC